MYVLLWYLEHCAFHAVWAFESVKVGGGVQNTKQLFWSWGGYEASVFRAAADAQKLK